MSAVQGERWAAVGHSQHADAATAAREALAACGRDDAALLLVFAAGCHDLGVIGATLRDAAPGAAIAGATTSGGEIVAAGPVDDAVVIVALGGDGLSISTAVAALDGHPREAAATAAACVGDVVDRGHRVLILLGQDTADDHRELVRGAYSVAGAAVALVGGYVAPTDPGRSCILHDGDALGNAVVAVAIGSDAPIGAAVRHGMSAIGEPLFVSSASGCDLIALDDEPALDAYLRRIEAPDPTGDDADALRARARRHPLGVNRLAGEMMLHGTASLKRDTPVLTLDAPIAPGTLAWVMDGTADNLLAATDDACADALAALDGAPPRALLVFDCITRRHVLGSATVDEVARIAAHADGAPIAGCYTAGEIARTSGISGFHNQTIVVLALA